jgi:hypothetical protein
MYYQVKQFCWRYKLFCWQNNGKCLIIVARGNMDKQAFLRVFHEIVKVTKPLDGCKVLLDLRDANCDLGLDDLVESKAELGSFPWHGTSELKLAMLTTRLPEQYSRLSLLKVPVSELGIDVGVFYDEKRSIDWLAEETSHCLSEH